MKENYIRHFVSMCLVLALFTWKLNGQGGENNLHNEPIDWKVLPTKAPFLIDGDKVQGMLFPGNTAAWLVTGGEFRNFVLEYEMKIPEGISSGVLIRSGIRGSGDSVQVKGLRVVCEDSPIEWTGGVFDESLQGWRYPLSYNPIAGKTYRNEDWNRFEVFVEGTRILTRVNGTVCANLLEAGSETGHVALYLPGVEDHALAGKKVIWRNIIIRDLAPGELDWIHSVSVPEVSYLKNQLTEREKENGWRLLWDGKTSAGWRGARLASFPESGWEIRDGVLSVLSSGEPGAQRGGDIVTVSKYRNFILEVDFRITKGANSGIKYFVDTGLNQGQGSSIGCEFQILDDLHHPDGTRGVNGNRTMGSLYDLIPADGREYLSGLVPNKLVHPTGQWNRARIEVEGNMVKHYLNGIKVVEYERATQMWKALVDHSKYDQWSGFGENSDGNILLQDHRDEVSFMNIKIRELPAEGQSVSKDAIRQ